MPKLKVGVCDGEGGVLVSTAGDGVIAVGSEGSKGVHVGEPRLCTRSWTGVTVGVDNGKLQLADVYKQHTQYAENQPNFFNTIKGVVVGEFYPK